MKDQDERRHWLLELLAWWEGSVHPSRLAEHWQMSRQHASKQLKRYNQLHPEALQYLPTEKTYHPTDAFKPVFISGDVVEYLNWATQHILPWSTDDAAPELPYETLSHPPRQVTPQLMRPLIRAIREQRRLDVDYVSLSNPDHEGRILVPHHFVNNGQRWHLRAWCEKSQDYRDFVLSRFRGEPELLNPSEQGAAQDHAWNTLVPVILQPDPRLTPAQREVIEQDYSMQNGQLQITTRACHVNYLLKGLQIHPRMLEGEPEAQQLIIVNKSDIQPWLFDA
ncbi:helix-turn-helix transcriptional regulator [Marinospirillum alkaliphilum]|uniref:WYL domain-containing protein n=1 Tax=Marinospirillum alkaliphilum DSM 21637 TaxID=1122209 RepID=A0A1K1W9P8_9GAMM|nr:WYL domain-containing protein [Marinospirillum alkaliphilum]SFX34102.1 WYL domain-containing protein [Marinospirillum alkaliphilum DSM 21637]